MSSTTAESTSGFMVVLRRDLRVALRRRSDTFSTLIFFVMVVSLFPLGVGSRTKKRNFASVLLYALWLR